MNVAPPDPKKARIVNPQGSAPQGISDFSQLVQGRHCFVDKTLFIKEILDGGNAVTLITRPRRFGKTINLNMLRCFLHWPPEHQPDLFDGLAISKAGESYQQERGKRPVLFLTFKDVKAENWDDAWIGLRDLLSVIAETHAHEAPVDRLKYSQQKTLNRVIEGVAEPAECQSILAILTQLLTLKHNGLSPWVLIDEYDTPLHAAYQADYYPRMRDMIRGLLGQCLKDNIDPGLPQTFLHKAVITGIVRVSKEDIFSDLNNLGVYGVTEDRFADSFGFTEAEVKELLSGRDMDNRLDPVRDWYNGYRFGRATTIYNPWSVISYLANPNDEARPYWVNTSTNHLVHHLLSRSDTGVKQGLRQLLDPALGHTTTQPVCEYVPLREVEHDPKNLWGLLLAAGYLTSVARQGIDGSNDQLVTLRVPNREVLGVYGDLVRSWLRGGKSGSGSGMEVLEALVAGNLDVFAEEFCQLVEESVGYFDTGGKHPERFYHGFVLGMVQYLRDRYIIRSERESGGGRYDLALEPKDKSMPGFVMEFKKGLRADGTLEQAADKALRQIKEREYHADLLNRGVKQVIALGLAFKGKEACVEYKNIHDDTSNS